MVSTGKKESSSHWAAKGLSSLSAKALAESRKASCCSVRSKFMVLTFLRIQIFEHLARKLKSASSPLSLLGGRGRGLRARNDCDFFLAENSGPLPNPLPKRERELYKRALIIFCLS